MLSNISGTDYCAIGREGRTFQIHLTVCWQDLSDDLEELPSESLGSESMVGLHSNLYLLHVWEMRQNLMG